MRDTILILFFCWASVMTLRHVWVGALLWTWISTMSPHRLTWGFTYDLPFAQVAAILALVSLLLHLKKTRWPSDPLVGVLLLWILWTCITTAFAIFPEQSFTQLVDRIFKVQLMTLLCMAVLRERKHIEAFIWVLALSVGFYGVKGGIFAIATGGGSRVWGPAGTLMSGNNEIGLALVMVIPLLNYLRMVSPRVWVRMSLLAAMLLCSVAALATQSRGAFLAVAAMGAVMWWRSSKKVIGAVAIGLAAVSLLSFMPTSWDARMETISNYQADASAMGRINAWTTAFNLANDRITGGGFFTATGAVFERYSPNPDNVLTAHSIYFQALGEQGWIGLGLFLLMGFMSFRIANQLRKRGRERPETAWLNDLGSMLQVSMVGYAVGGAFLSLTYLDLIFNMMVILVTAKFWLAEERWRTETTGAFGSTSATRAKQAVSKPRHLQQAQG